MRRPKQGIAVNLPLPLRAAFGHKKAADSSGIGGDSMKAGKPSQGDSGFVPRLLILR